MIKYPPSGMEFWTRLARDISRPHCLARWRRNEGEAPICAPVIRPVRPRLSLRVSSAGRTGGLARLWSLCLRAAGVSQPSPRVSAPVNQSGEGPSLIKVPRMIADARMRRNLHLLGESVPAESERFICQTGRRADPQ